MRKLRYILRNTTLYVMAVVLVGGVPVTTFAEEPDKYTYDEASGRWNTSKWVFDPVQNRYVAAPSSTSTSPSSEEAKTEKSTADATTAANPADGNATVGENINAASDTNITTDASINNGLNLDSTSGDAGVKSNTKAGGAMTGNADADTTIINSIHSTVGGETSGVANFKMDIYGDVVGDITLGPAIDNAQVDRNININSDMNVDSSGAITNDVKVRVASGDAEVSGNTAAGGAMTGNAHAVANVLNLVNTLVAANKSFVGTINIYGNLNGDILISPEFIPQLLADNSIERTEIDMPLSMNLNDDQQIVNNVKLNATTGDATVKDNTAAGSAKTGTAQTKLTILNLTGRQVDASKSLLVFVNVLGKWVGMIVDAPNATAAAFGSGVVNNSVNVADNTNVNTKSKITNNLDIAAESGDATVAKNTGAGDAESGDATASANIANISSSSFQLSDWFGVLFINVFGTWTGSFGIDTEAGTVVPLSGMALPQHEPVVGAPNLRFGFNAKNDPQVQLTTLGLGASSGSGGNEASAAALMATVSGQKPLVPNAPMSRTYDPYTDPFNLIMAAAGFTVAGISGAWYVLRRRQEIKAAAADTAPTGLVLSR